MRCVFYNIGSEYNAKKKQQKKTQLLILREKHDLNVMCPVTGLQHLVLNSRKKQVKKKIYFDSSVNVTNY